MKLYKKIHVRPHVYFRIFFCLYHLLFVTPLFVLAQSTMRGIEKIDIRRGMVIAKPGNTVSHRPIMPYLTPVGYPIGLQDMQKAAIWQPEIGISIPFTRNVKLTKADAARSNQIKKSTWALNVQGNLFSFTPHHLLDGHEQQVSSFAVTENTRKNWTLYTLHVAPEWRVGGEKWYTGINIGPSLVQNQPAQFRQGDPGQSVLYQDYVVPAEFHKLRFGAQGHIRFHWFPFQRGPIGFYAEAGYIWQQPYTFQVRERDISKVNFNLSPDEIRYQLSNPQIAPFVEKSYAIPHSFFEGHIGLSLVIKTKSTPPRVEQPQTERLVIKTKSTPPVMGLPNAYERQSKQGFQIVLDQPRPHAVFRSVDEVPAFRWHVVGEPPADAQYRLEVFQLNDRGNIIRQVASASVVPGEPYHLPAEEKARLANVPQTTYYSWKVTETTTGTSSGQPQYSVSGSASCGTVTDSIHIECDGWDVQSGLPKYQVKICLTNNPTSGTSGCAVTYTSITSNSGGTISNTNVLPPQVSIGPYAHFCITFTYIPASLSQTTASFTTFGNWNDALHNTANVLSTDSLPSCICRDCDSMNIQILNPQVQMQSADPHLFDITGAVQVNPQSVYAIEFSVQSFSFTATPGGCAGVDSLEHDGMLVSNGTTVNGSNAGLVFGNAPTGNPNIFKLIKWISSSPVPAGTSIPFDLVIGLPAASGGIDPSCCRIDYRLCLQVKVYYDACRYCTKTICLQFSNTTQKP